VTQVKTGNVNQVFVGKELVSGDQKMIAAIFMRIVILVYIVAKILIGLIKVYVQF
jgi:hypothetical protein